MPDGVQQPLQVGFRAAFANFSSALGSRSPDSDLGGSPLPLKDRPTTSNLLHGESASILPGRPSTRENSNITVVTSNCSRPLFRF